MSKRRNGPTPRKPWTPFVEVRRTTIGMGPNERLFQNSRYIVSLETRPQDGMDGSVHLSIHDYARSTRHDWRDLQRIKNELVGPEREAVELYPAESRVVDTSNEYHLWVFPAGMPVPIGYSQGSRADQGEMPSEEELEAEAARRGVPVARLRARLTRAKQRRFEVPDQAT